MKDIDLYRYKAEVTRIIDGDTVELRVFLGFNIYKLQTIRLFGVNCPESRTTNPDEKKLGIAAKEFTEKTIPPGTIVHVRTIKYDKYGGRCNGIIYMDDDKTLNQELLDNGHAKEYLATLPA